MIYYIKCLLKDLRKRLYFYAWNMLEFSTWKSFLYNADYISNLKYKGQT